MMLQSDSPPSDPFVAALRRRLSKQAFETWFQPLTVFSDQRDGVVRISAPNTVVRDWILSTYSAVLDESLLELKLSGGRIEWILPRPKVNQGPHPTPGYEVRSWNQVESWKTFLLNFQAFLRRH
jgi:chromosomal replication initiation ATPase DnaA